MREMPTIPDDKLMKSFELCIDMIDKLGWYIKNMMEKSGGRPYNHINDGVTHQNHDFVSLYFKLTKLLNPILLEENPPDYEGKIKAIKRIVEAEGK